MPLWRARSVWARASRVALLPAAAAYAGVMVTRRRLYAGGWLERQSLPLPSVGVGNLTVGGAGKTPVAAWVARWYVAQGHAPAILLRGYGGDEGAIHRALVPQAQVHEDPDRRRAGARAAAAGADVLVLDDALQHLRVRPTVSVVLVSAESWAWAPWPLPAGPWRERCGALREADLVLVTRRVVSRTGADVVARALAPHAGRASVGLLHLRLAGWHGLRSGRAYPLETVRGASVLAACGIADPDSFQGQVAGCAGRVRRMVWPDHHPYGARDVRRLLGAAREVDYVVVTAKDAVKLRRWWPPEGPEPLVADLEVGWERGLAEATALLERCLGSPGPTAPRSAGARPVDAAASAAERT